MRQVVQGSAPGWKRSGTIGAAAALPGNRGDDVAHCQHRVAVPIVDSANGRTDMHGSQPVVRYWSHLVASFSLTAETRQWVFS